MNKNISELFSPPTGLSPAYKIEGTTFYSSDKLKKNFVLAFAKSSKGKHVTKEIQKLVESDTIIPCYKSKNVLSFIKHKLVGDNKYIMAFYAIHDKKVVVIIDNSASIFGTSSNNELTSTTMHECMHLIAGKNLNKFLQVFSPRLRSYYSEFFMDYFDMQRINIKKVDEVIKYLAVCERRGPMYANKNLPNFFKLLEKLFKDDSRASDFQERLSSLMVAIKLFIVSMPTLLKNSRQFSMVFTALNNAYLNAFGKKNIYTTPIQELISPSEVACVLSEMRPQDSTIKKLFQIIA